MNKRVEKIVSALFVVAIMGLFSLPLIVFPGVYGYKNGYYILAVLTLLQLLRFLVSVVKRSLNELRDNA